MPAYPAKRGWSKERRRPAGWPGAVPAPSLPCSRRRDAAAPAGETPAFLRGAAPNVDGAASSLPGNLESFFGAAPSPIVNLARSGGAAPSSIVILTTADSAMTSGDDAMASFEVN